MEEFLDLASLLKNTIAKTSSELVKSVSVNAVNRLIQDSYAAEHPEFESPMKEKNELMMETYKSGDENSCVEKGTLDNAAPNLKISEASPKKGAHHRWDGPQIQVATTKRDTSMIGIITVKLLSCSDLINTDADTFGGLSDPYVILKIGKVSVFRRGKRTLSTHSLMKSLNLSGMVPVL